MKNFMAFPILFVALGLSTANAQTAAATNQTDFDFRHTNWGMSIDQVKTAEAGNRLVQSVKDDMLSYDLTIGGSDALVIYTFNDNDKLVQARYVFTKIYVAPELYIDDFHKLQHALQEKYGAGSAVENDWHDTQASRDEANWGRSVAQGWLTMAANWQTQKTDIRLWLGKDGGQIVLQVDYTSRSIPALESREQHEDLVKNL